jgi:hypothetical protein
METIEDRIDELQHLGAGDEQCQECLEISMEPMAVCRKCIADTPEFSRVVRSIMESKTPSNALAQGPGGSSPGPAGATS